MLGREPRGAQGPRKLFGPRCAHPHPPKTPALAGFAFPPCAPREPRPRHGPQGPPRRGGRKTQGGREDGNDEDPARGVRREQAPEPQGAGRRLGAGAQHRGERPDHPAHRGGRRRGLPAGRRAQAHRRHALARARGGRRLRDGRLGRRAHRVRPQRREQPPQGAHRGRARARHPDDALAGGAGGRRCGVGRHPGGEGRVLRARREGRAG